jgi:homoserine kinase type II
MHVAGLDYPAFRKNSLSFEGWRALFLQVKDNADTVQEGLAEDIEKELDTLHKIWPTDLPTGIIHADLFPDNVFFDYENLSGLIDFYFACNDFFAYDFAVCLNAWCFQSSAEFNRNKARLLFSGYQTVRGFDEAEIQLLPLLARGAALRFLLTRLYDWLNKSDGALVNPKDPLEFLGKLHFHRNCKGPEDYGIRDI